MAKNKLFEGFRYRIDLLKPGESAILKWPEIAAYSDVFLAADTGVDDEIIAKYLILMYTPGSPAITQNYHLKKRKTWVMDFLGISADSDGRYMEYDNMLRCRGEGMRRRLVTYLSIQQSTDWAIFCHAQLELESVMELDPSGDPDILLKRRKLIEEIRLQIADAKDRIMVDGKERSMEDAIDWFYASRRLELRREEQIISLEQPVIPQRAKASPHE